MEVSKENTKEIAELAQLIASGQATASDLGTACKSLQVGMAVTLINGLQRVNSGISVAASLQDKLITKFNEVLEANISQGVLDDPDELLSYIERLNNIQCRTLDLQRKIAQGKELIPETNLSDDEKMIVKLFKSFKSKDEKEKFIKVVNDTLKENTSSDDLEFEN